MLEHRSRIPPDHPGAGRFTGQGPPIPSRSASIRTRLKDVLAEETEDEDGRRLTWAERVARGLVQRAERGAVDAAKLILEQTEEPISRQPSDPEYRVTIQYVQVNQLPPRE